MPEQPEEHQDSNNNETLWLLQINLNKSKKAHLDIIDENLSQDYDLILIQEPHTTIFNAIRTPTNFRPVFPAHRLSSQDQIHSVMWVSRKQLGVVRHPWYERHHWYPDQRVIWNALYLQYL